MKVYIAGPYTKGDVVLNVRWAILIADQVLERGHVPYVPHLTHFWHLLVPHTWETWLALDLEWLRDCDVVLRLPGESVGADLEVAEALKLGIRVVYRIEDLSLNPPGVDLWQECKDAGEIEEAAV